jgi:peptidoglycan/LPS O-acetylase OafA/YrhL
VQYRRDIDGLRAVAVLPVMLFHAGFDAFAGGFVGVDVFFVISGYLITALILADLEQGRFSIRQFYERRARRILPALFFVMACCIPLAWAWMVPDQFREFSLSVIAVSLFASNILFWQRADYFAPRSEENPLLHTWSLAIEEQFYIVFPILLLIAWRLGRSPTFWAVVAGTLGSLALAEYGARNHPAPTFYLLPTRAWELGIGALCAFAHHRRERRPHAGLTALGVAMIAYAVLVYDAETPFPSLHALVPVGGAALVILFGSTSGPAGRLLSTPLLVGIGLVSYSAYLWHQPLYAFARIRSESYPTTELLVGLTVAALALAWLTWRFVELPFRRRPVPVLPSRRAVFAASAMGIAGFVAFGAYGEISDGRLEAWRAQNPGRAAIYDLHAEADAIRGVWLDDGACRFNVRYWTPAAEQRVLACAEEHGRAWAVLGDSHGVDLFNGFYETAPTEFLVGATSNCQPYTPRVECPYPAFAAFVEANPDVFETVLYTEAGYRWIRTTDGRVSGRELFARVPETNPMERDAYRILPASPVTLDYLDRLQAVVPVVWIGPRIEPHISLNHLLSRGCRFDYALRPGLERLFRDVDAEIARAAADRDFLYVSQIGVTDLDLPQDLVDCAALYWRDGDHWSLEGAARFVGRLLAQPPFTDAWSGDQAGVSEVRDPPG